MMKKGILEFKLPQEKEAFDIAVNAESILYNIQDFNQFLRNEIKYNQELSEEKVKIFEEIREKLFNIFKEDDLLRFL